MVFGENGTKNCWSTEVKDIFSKNNLGHVFSTFPFNIKATIDSQSHSLLRKAQTKWKNDCNNMPKLRTYVKMDDFFRSKSYLSKPLSFVQRKFLAKFRLGVLPIRIETGRYERPRLAENDRICLVCDEVNAIENEQHFLMTCSAYNRIRNDLFSKVEADDFLTWDSTKQFQYLTCDSSIVKSTAQFIINAFDFRSTKT